MRPGHSVLILLLAFFAGAAAPAAGEAQSQVIVLENGIRAAVERVSHPHLVHLVLALRAGSKYEPAGRKGLSHLIEHLLLFGSDNSGGASFTRRLSERGGLLNGHTDRDLLTVEMTFPPSELDFAVGLIRRMVFERRFHAADLEREREVVRREAEEIEDSPERSGLFLLLNHLFAGHPYERSAMGDPRALDGVGLEEIMRHYRGLFRPERCAVALVGDLDSVAASACLKTHLGGIQAGTPGESDAFALPPPAPLTASPEIERRMDVKRAHLWLGFRAPAYNHVDRVAMRVLTQMLGQGGYSLLSVSLSGRFQWVDSVSMHYQAMEDSGFAWIHMVLDPANVRRARHEVMRFLKYFRNMDFSVRDLPPAQRRGVFDFLQTAENQLLSRLEADGEDGMNRALSTTRFLLLNRLARPNGFAAQAAALSSSRLRAVAGDYLLKPAHVEVTLLPQKTHEKK